MTSPDDQHDAHPWPPTDARFRAGAAAFAWQFDIPVEDVPAWFERTVGREFGTQAIYSSAEAWIDDELSLHDRNLISLSAMIAMGAVPENLEQHGKWSVANGISDAEIDKMCGLLAVYVGFSRAQSGLRAIHAARAAARAEGRSLT